MLERAAGLGSRELEAVAVLEREVIEADGGRLKLEWGLLRSRSGDRVEDLLWWEGDQLVGFLGLYGFGSTVELAGMVAPAARRGGIATALLDAAMPLCRERGSHKALLIVPRLSVAGRQLALGRQGRLDHSEHALVLDDEVLGGQARHQDLVLRQAIDADIPAVARLLEVGFGGPAPELAGRLNSARSRTLVVEVGGATVGTLSLVRDGEYGGIYGFVIDPSWQGRGVGRDALARACLALRADGAQRTGLEVAVENDRALGLYTSTGFTPVTTEDYYALPLS